MRSITYRVSYNQINSLNVNLWSYKYTQYNWNTLYVVCTHPYHKSCCWDTLYIPKLSPHQGMSLHNCLICIKSYFKRPHQSLHVVSTSKTHNGKHDFWLWHFKSLFHSAFHFPQFLFFFSFFLSPFDFLTAKQKNSPWYRKANRFLFRSKCWARYRRSQHTKR